MNKTESPLTHTINPSFSKNLVRILAWPTLVTLCVTISAYGFMQDNLIMYFNLAYTVLVLNLFFLEKWLPWEAQWQKPDGQNTASILHTLTSKGTVQGLFAASAAIGLAQLLTPLSEPATGIWPRDWELVSQVILGLVVAEFGLYWAHRLSHEFEILWRFHAIHHAVTKLWFLNTGRFHFIDSLVSILAVLILLASLGAPMEVVQWVSILTAFFGVLTHCNVDMRCGPLNYVFNTPQLHRWHHSKQLHEGNRNYGENIVWWDILFGTYYNKSYRPPADIGIKEVSPSTFLLQLAWPFMTPSMRKKRIAHYEHLPFSREGLGFFPEFNKDAKALQQATIQQSQHQGFPEQAASQQKAGSSEAP